MERDRFSWIGHGQLPVWNPAGPRHLKRYIARLALPDNGFVLDIGCGRGYLLKHILSEFQVQGIGVDRSPYAIAHAENDLGGFVAAGRLALFRRAFVESEYEPARFDFLACVGATHAVGSYRATLRTARRLLHAGGLLLVGEGYWKRTPNADYLSLLDMAQDQLVSHADNQVIGHDEGFELVACSECSQQEWDAYEQRYAQNVEEYAGVNPHDPDASAMLARIRSWREGYLRWGRDTLGFGLYLFRL